MKINTRIVGLLSGLFFAFGAFAKNPSPPQTDSRIYDIVAATSAERIEADIRRVRRVGVVCVYLDHQLS